MKIVTPCPKKRDENGLSAMQTVTVFVTSLSYQIYSAGGEHAAVSV